jgi:hypothetical protein
MLPRQPRRTNKSRKYHKIREVFLLFIRNNMITQRYEISF